MTEADLFSSILADMASGVTLVSYQKTTRHERLTEALMKRSAEKGPTLAYLSRRDVMNRSIRTLQRNCRRFGLVFPDYTPMKLRKKDEPKA